MTKKFNQINSHIVQRHTIWDETRLHKVIYSVYVCTDSYLEESLSEYTHMIFLLHEIVRNLKA